MKITSIPLAGLLATFLAGSASAATYSQDFTAANGTVNGGLGDGSFIASDIENANVSTGPGPGSIQSNALLLTAASTGSTRSSFRVPALANSSLGWTATFDLRLTDIAGGNPPADGFSFSYGAIANFIGTSGQVGNTPLTGADHHGVAEAGFGSGNEISFVVDTWQNGEPTNSPGLGILQNGTGLVGGRLDGIVLPNDADLTATVSITWSPATASFTTTGLNTNANFTNLAHTFAGNDAFVWAFSARTGGATEDLIIDNLRITTIPEPTGLALLGLGLGGALLRRRRA